KGVSAFSCDGERDREGHCRCVGCVLITVPMPSGYRIMASRHRSNPLGTTPADFRFCTRNVGFTVLYAAPEFATAFIETVVRDRFTGRQSCEVAVREITARGWPRISMQQDAVLTLVDLRGDGCTRIGVPTDKVNASNHPASRAFAKAIHADHGNVDGVLYGSRLTGEDLYAVFDRSAEKLTSVETGLLEDHPKLPDILRSYGIGLVA
ncbi:MAG: RES family NAD+ phosphorylase, partial [Rhodospirillales bacterium]|nr:RES family NAD+ phosphorylase [Rhodospirillales bacterium]